jgi:hypothetical protein
MAFARSEQDFGQYQTWRVNLRPPFRSLAVPIFPMRARLICGLIAGEDCQIAGVCLP